MMYEYELTVGLYDKDAESQIIPTEAAREIIADILIDGFDISAFTMLDCYGVYRMSSTGRVVREPSIRIEIALENMLSSEIADDIISALKTALKQETIMIKTIQSDINFF